VSERSDVVRRVPDADLGAIFGNRTDGLGGLAPRRPRQAPAPTPSPAPEVSAAAVEQAPAATDGDAPAAPGTPVAEPEPESASAAPARTKSRGVRTLRTEATASGPRRSTRTAPASADTAVPRLVILQLPNGIADQLRDNARSRGVTYKELTLDAVEATADRLADLLAAARPQARGTGLFAGERTSAQARPEGRRQVSIKLTEGSITALDELAEKLGARSRSELVATALRAYLSE